MANARNDARFEAALLQFLDVCQQVILDYRQGDHPNVPRDAVQAQDNGLKYVRVVRHSYGQVSVHAFVRIEDGAVLYPAGWKKPFIAKGGPNDPKTVRGNIFAEDHGRSAMGPYGVRTL